MEIFTDRSKHKEDSETLKNEVENLKNKAISFFNTEKTKEFDYLLFSNIVYDYILNYSSTRISKKISNHQTIRALIDGHSFLSGTNNNIISYYFNKKEGDTTLLGSIKTKDDKSLLVFNNSTDASPSTSGRFKSPINQNIIIQEENTYLLINRMSYVNDFSKINTNIQFKFNKNFKFNNYQNQKYVNQATAKIHDMLTKDSVIKQLNEIILFNQFMATNKPIEDFNQLITPEVLKEYLDLSGLINDTTLNFEVKNKNNLTKKQAKKI